MSALINDPVLATIFTDIQVELGRSKALHPNYPTDTLRRGAIVNEELAEVMVEVVAVRSMKLQHTLMGATRVDQHANHTMADVRKELIQTAAMCVKFLEAIDAEAQK